MPRIRTFIALDLAVSVKEQLAGLQSDLGRLGDQVKWVSPANMHLTLLFLGEVNPLDLVPICRVVQERARNHQGFTFDAHSVGGFPNNRRPKILWAGIGEGIESIRVLHADLEDGLLELGCYRREERDYNPHLTVGRLSPDADADAWGRTLANYAAWHGGSTTVDEVLIMSSELRRDGPEYGVVGRAELR